MSCEGPGSGKLSARGVEVAYGERRVLRSVDLEVAPGTLVGLIGPNGAGKSTLLRCLAGLQAFAGGQVAIDGDDLRTLSPRRAAQRIAVVPQTCFPAFPVRVDQFVGMGRFAHERFFGGPTRRDRDVVARCLAELGITGLADRPVDALSGGEFRRVLIAQALAQEADVLLLDEPVQQLDLLHQIEVMEFARTFARRPGHAGVVVLHELGLAARYCDPVVLLGDGGVLASGSPEAVLTKANLRRAYGVEAAIGRCQVTGALTIVPVAPTA